MKLALVINQRGQQQIKKVSLQENSPLTIGRGWQSDVVVDDDYVDGLHARLSVDESGQLRLQDLGSENGTQLGKNTISDSIAVESGASIKIGDTTIVVHDTSISVAPAVKRNAVRLFSNRFASVGGVVAATVIASLGLLLSIYAMEGVAATGERVLSTFLGAGMLLFVWCLLAALVGKLFRNETNASLHWVFASIVLALMLATTFVTDVIKFNLDSGLASTVIDNVLVAGLIALVGFVTFSLTTRLSTAKKMVTVTMLALLPVGHSLLQPTLVEEHEAWTYWAPVEQVSHPPAFLFRSPTSLDAHLSATDGLFAALKEELQAVPVPQDADSLDKDLQISIID